MPRPQTQEPACTRYFCHILINFLQGFGHSLPRRSKSSICRAPFVVDTIPTAHSCIPYPEVPKPQPLHHSISIPGPLGALLTQHHSVLSPAPGHIGLKQTFPRLPTLTHQPRKGFWGCSLDTIDADITPPTIPWTSRCLLPACLPVCSRCQSCLSGLLPHVEVLSTALPHPGEMPRWVTGNPGNLDP